MKKTPTVTSLPRSPQEGRDRRMANYFIAMSIRVVCIILCLFVPGWWALIPAIGAIILPYIAVVLANVGAGESAGVPLRPGGLLPTEPREPVDPVDPADPRDER